MLKVSKSNKKISKGNTSSPLSAKDSISAKRGQSPLKIPHPSQTSPKAQLEAPIHQPMADSHACKRKPARNNDRPLLECAGIGEPPCAYNFDKVTEITFLDSCLPLGDKIERQTVDDCDLSDLAFLVQDSYGTIKRDGNGNIQERLDRFLANGQWMDKFWNAEVLHLGFNSSDHRSILLKCAPNPPFLKGRGRNFGFEPFWLKEEDFMRTIDNSWKVHGDSDSSINLKAKLNKCASILNCWSKNRSFEKSDDGMLDSEEIYWRQRSGAEWLQLGDRNTKYFHVRATTKKKKNFISRLIDINGCVQDIEDGLARTVSDFFSSLFNSSNPSVDDLSEVLKAIKARLTDNMGFSQL
ncbi:hypothetical protein Dsin_012252 [Dipteronia sinensis]|uniref:Uncharacterized protein n=1 Tax=Dipteronia sinensis TaxID=43782 RepID=A0AAE0AHR0_9ROSI|nr:hypothetical protein Dsin_012252 [Dipteronia sinensis]